jgi:hypothetical protein
MLFKLAIGSEKRDGRPRRSTRRTRQAAVLNSNLRWLQVPDLNLPLLVRGLYDDTAENVVRDYRSAVSYRPKVLKAWSRYWRAISCRDSCTQPGLKYSDLVSVV